jgi:hypothetical protein
VRSVKDFDFHQILIEITWNKKGSSKNTQNENYQGLSRIQTLRSACRWRPISIKPDDKNYHSDYTTRFFQRNLKIILRWSTADLQILLT